jgi:hypothetical protein
MAGQKKDASTSILLRRVLDRTPLRPANLEGFRSGTVSSPAQFVARYFERNFGVLQRWLGGVPNLGRRPIGQRIIARYTNFHQSFGPIQRSLRPQPERRSRRHAQGGEDLNSFEAEDYPDFDYAQEPAYAQPNYNDAVGQPGGMPWEGPLNPTPAQVARRLDFQPANLRYLTSPERSPEPIYRAANPAGDYASQAQTREVISRPPTQSLGYPKSSNFATPTSPEGLPVSNYSEPVQREASPARPEANFATGPVDRSLIQPALSRAVQRTAEATLARPGVGNLGASPAAVSRHLALPHTVARYRALKQTADKILLGEQSGPAAPEAASARYLQPELAQPAFNPPNIQRASQANNSPVQAQRIPEATNPLLETQRQTSPFLEAQRPAGEAGQVQAFEASGLNQGVQPGEVQRIATPTTPANRAPETGHTLSPSATAPIVVSRSYPAEGALEGRPASRLNQEVGTGSNQVQAEPGRALNSSENEIAYPLFDAAIPASLLNDSFRPGEVSGGVQRLAANRPGAPLVTGAWAARLAALRNNPGVAASSSSSLARPSAEAQTGGAWAAPDSPMVYTVQRRLRRGETATAETQDRIFGLAESNNALADFQPQFLKSMAAEEPAPLPPNPNRGQPVPLASPLNPPAEKASIQANSPSEAAEPALNQTEPATPALNRPNSAFASEQANLAVPATASSEAQAAALAETQATASSEAAPATEQSNPALPSIQAGISQPTAL